MATQTREAGRRPTLGHRSVVVGVDGSRHSRTAALWASEEADQRRVPLSLVTACRLPVLSGQDAMTYPLKEIEEYTRADLVQLAQHLPNQFEDVRVGVASGDPDNVLLEAVEREHAGLLVVGKRGLGAVSRVFLGSTSIGVAGRSPVPVVIVPDQWVQTGHLSAPIVLGLPPGQVEPDVLDFAFARASRLHVPLVVLTAPTALPAHPPVGAPPDLTWHEQYEIETGQALEPWQARFPEVEVALRSVVGDAAAALLDAAGTSQLLVLGRHPRTYQSLGLRLASTIRTVLHDAECPVAVVPIDSDESGGVR